MKYRLSCLILAVCLLVCIVGCSNGKEADSENETENSSTESTHKHTFSEATCTQAQTCSCGEVKGEPLGHDIVDNECTRCEYAELLSEKCDKVLAVGIDGENKYELVANESEDYNGVVVEVGVIKNNKWLIEPTTDSPLVDEDKTLFGSNVSGLDTAPTSIYYIGNNCFLYKNIYQWGTGGTTYEDVVFNVENNKYYINDGTETKVNHPTKISYEDNDIIAPGDYELYGETVLVTDCETEVWQCLDYGKKVSIELINTTSMDTRVVDLERYELSPICNPFNDGLFAIVNFHGEARFYDSNGKIVIDLSSYELTHIDQPLMFIDGKCTFTIFNNNDNIYEITIDKKGNVIDSVER